MCQIMAHAAMIGFLLPTAGVSAAPPSIVDLAHRTIYLETKTAHSGSYFNGEIYTPQYASN